MSSSRQVSNDFSERFRILINYDNSINEGYVYMSFVVNHN